MEGGTDNLVFKQFESCDACLSSPLAGKSDFLYRVPKHLNSGFRTTACGTLVYRVSLYYTKLAITPQVDHRGRGRRIPTRMLMDVNNILVGAVVHGKSVPGLRASLLPRPPRALAPPSPTGSPAVPTRPSPWCSLRWQKKRGECLLPACLMSLRRGRKKARSVQKLCAVGKSIM